MGRLQNLGFDPYISSPSTKQFFFTSVERGDGGIIMEEEKKIKNKSYDSRFISYVNKWPFLLAVDSDLRSPIEIIAEKKRSRNDVLKRCGACRCGLGSLHAWQAAQFMIVQLLSLYLLLHYRRRTGMLRQLFHEEIRIERFGFNLVSPQKYIQDSQDLVKVVLFTWVTKLRKNKWVFAIISFFGYQWLFIIQS